MFEDLTYSQEAWERHCREASDTLAACIARAREGLPTGAPTGLAWERQHGRITRPWADREIAEMRLMRDAGYSVRQIADALERTHESVKDGIRRHLRGFARDGRLLQEPAE